MLLESLKIALIISSIAKLLILMDPFGNLPAFVAVIKSVKNKSKAKFLFNEMLISYGLMIFLIFGGSYLICKLLAIPLYVIYISGGIILFAMGYQIIFSGSESLSPESESITDGMDKDPFIFPVTMPLTVGPGVITYIILISSIMSYIESIIVISISWIIFASISMTAPFASKLIESKKGLVKGIDFAVGFLIIMNSVDTFCTGLKLFNAS